MDREYRKADRIGSVEGPSRWIARRPAPSACVMSPREGITLQADMPDGPPGAAANGPAEEAWPCAATCGASCHALVRSTAKLARHSRVTGCPRDRSSSPCGAAYGLVSPLRVLSCLFVGQQVLSSWAATHALHARESRSGAVASATRNHVRHDH